MNPENEEPMKDDIDDDIPFDPSLSRDQIMLDSARQIAKDDTPIFKKGIEHMVNNVMNKGMMLKDAAGIKSSDLETLYAQAYQLYNTGKFEESRALFALLVNVDPIEPKYLFGVAACSHMLEQYEQAANCYNHSALLENENPVPYYHCADCYMKLEDKFSAIVVLKLCLERCGNKPQYSVIKDRAQMTLKKAEEEGAMDLTDMPPLSPDELPMTEKVEWPKDEELE